MRNDEELLTVLMPDLWRLARILAIPPQEPEDLAQDVLLRVWTRIKEGAEIEALRPYLMTALRNHARRRQPRSITLDESTLPPTEAEAPRRIACAEVLAAIDALPPRDAVLFRRIIRDAPALSDLALDLRLPLGTVQSRLCRARGRLRRDLGIAAGQATDQLIGD